MADQFGKPTEYGEQASDVTAAMVDEKLAEMRVDRERVARGEPSLSFLRAIQRDRQMGRR